MTDWSRFSATPPGGEPAPAGGGTDWSRFSAEPPPKPTLFQQAKSGLSRSFEEVPGLVAGVGAYAADAVGATDTRDSLLGYAVRKQEDVGAKHANDAQSFTDAWDGKTPWLDFLANTAGYVVGQVAQSIVTGGFGAVGGKMLATQAMKQAGEVAAAQAIAKGATEVAAREAAEVAMRAASTKAMTRGGIAGAGTQNIGMELGSIYPEAVKEAGGADNLDAGDKGRVLASSLAAAGVDTLADVVMAGRLLKGSKAGGAATGIMGRAAREVPVGMVREAGTEAIQTGLEHYGAGQPIADEKGLRDIIDSAAVGAVGGGMGGGIASLRRAAPALPDPVTKGLDEIAAAPTVDDAIKAAAAAVSGKPSEPTIGDRLASVKADAAGAMDAIRAKYGDESASQFLNSLAQAGNPRAPDAVREKHLQAVETLLFELRATRAEQPIAPLALGTGIAAQPALGYDGAPPQLGMGSTPTGTMRVGPDGRAFPETAADVTAGRPEPTPDGMTAQAPQGAPAYNGGGFYTISDAISADGPTSETVRFVVRPDGTAAIQRDNGDVIDVTNMIRAGFAPERAIAQSLGDDTSGANVARDKKEGPGPGVMQGDGTLTPGVTRRAPAPQTAMAQALLPLRDRLEAMRKKGPDAPTPRPTAGPVATEVATPTRAAGASEPAGSGTVLPRVEQGQAGRGTDLAGAPVAGGREAVLVGAGAADGEQALTKATSRFPRVADVPAMSAGLGGTIRPKPIAPGKALYRETNVDGLDDLLRLDGQSDIRQTYVTDNPDLAIGQGENKGVAVTFRPDALSGRERTKPGTGEMSGREYVTDIIAPRAVQTVTMSAADVKKLRGLTKRSLADFDREDLVDGRVRFHRKGLDRQNAAAPAPQQPAASPGAVVGPAAAAPATPRVPKSFRKRHKVKTRVFDEETGAFEEQESDADTALMAIQADISELRAFRLCLTGG